jgi:hypothetical protein
MGLFSSKPKQTDVELLQERSKNIVGVFTKTVEDLKAVNAEIETARQEKLGVIKQLEDEVKQITETAAKNSSIVDKIQKILE